MTQAIQLTPVTGVPGIRGQNGWSPLYAAVAIDSRRVFQVADWVGGEGAKPATGQYLGSTGLVDASADATDFAVPGPKGDKGDPGYGAKNITALSSISPVLDWNFTWAGGVLFSKYLTRATPGGYVWNSKGILLQTAANLPKIGYDPATGQPIGTLLDGARANNALQSGDFTASPWAWGGTAGTIAAGDAAPDHVGTFWTLAAGDGTTDRRQSIARTVNVRQTISIFAKRGNQPLAAFQCHNLGGTGVTTAVVGFSYNFDTGVIGTNATSATGVTVNSRVAKDCGNGVFRLIVDFTPSNGSTTVVPLLHKGGIVAGDTCQFWGLQHEIGAGATSYMPTTTVAVSRDADSFTINGTDFTDVYNPNEDTVYVDAVPHQTGANNIFMTIGGGGDSVYLWLSAAGNLYAARTGSSNLLLGTLGDSNRIAYAFKDGLFAASLNGAAAQTMNADMPVSPTSLSLSNCTVKRLALFPAALSANILQDMTA